MPAGAIQDKDDKSVRAGSDRAGEGRQDRAEHRRVRRVGQEPHHLPGGRADEAMDIEPSEAMVSDRPRTLAPACPDPADDRLEPGAMLVERPDLHRAVRVGARQLLYAGAEAGLERLLGGKVALGMPRTRYLTGEAEAAQVVPPPPRRDQTIDPPCATSRPVHKPPSGDGSSSARSRRSSF